MIQRFFVSVPALFALVFFLAACGNNSTSSSLTEVPYVIGVNKYVWYASLTTFSFLPIQSADPYSGVIITDWYMPSPTIPERYRVNVYILEQQLTSYSVIVRVFKQNLKNGVWVDIPTPPTLETSLENSILSMARQIRHRDLERRG